MRRAATATPKSTAWAGIVATSCFLLAAACSPSVQSGVTRADERVALDSHQSTDEGHQPSRRTASPVSGTDCALTNTNCDSREEGGGVLAQRSVFWELGNAFLEHTAQDRPANVEFVTNNEPDPGQRSQHVLLGIDCYGLDPAGDSCDTLSERAGLRTGDKRKLGWDGDDTADTIRSSSRDFALVNVSPVFYPDGSAYVNIDVVRRSEWDRMKLRPHPSERVKVRSNLLELYATFNNAWFGLFSQGTPPPATNGNGYWEYEDESLRVFVKLFVQEVPQHRAELIEVLLYEREPTRRRAAAGLLGYDRDPATTQALTSALLDPTRNVRAEAARALLPRLRRAGATGEVVMEVAPVIRMLGLPSASDRSLASSLLAELARIPQLRKPILDAAVPTLLTMLDASWPSASDQALLVLEAATGLPYGHDVDAWTRALQ